jgi:uncharacterized membrane protein YbhN (UPF0104 family)
VSSDDPTPPNRHLTSHIFSLAMLVVGGIALAWMLHDLGLSALREAIVDVGWWFALILALDIISLGCDAAALQAFMRPEARMVTYWRVLGAQASGRAISVLTPTGALGEPTKLAMLVTHAPRDRVLSSLVLLNLGQLYLSVAAIVIGTPIMFLLVDVPRELTVTILIAFAVIIPATVTLGMLVHRGALATIVRGIRRLGIISDERADRWRTRMTEVDRHIRELQTNRSHGTWKGFLWVIASKLTTWAATLTLLHTAGIDVSLALVIGTFSVGVVIQWVSQIVPMGLGLADGGNYALYALTGAAGAHGVVITMLNRARSLIVAIGGLCAMAVMHTLNRLALARMRSRLERLRERSHSS